MQILKKIIVINLSALLLLSNSYIRSMELTLEQPEIPDSCEPSRRDYKTPRKQKGSTDSCLQKRASYNGEVTHKNNSYSLQNNRGHHTADGYLQNHTSHNGEVTRKNKHSHKQSPQNHKKNTPHNIETIFFMDNMLHKIDVTLKIPEFTGTYSMKEGSNRQDISQFTFDKTPAPDQTQDILKQKFEIPQPRVETEKAYEIFLQLLKEENFDAAQKQAKNFALTASSTKQEQNRIRDIAISQIYHLQVQKILKQEFNITQPSFETEEAYKKFLQLIEEKKFYAAQKQAAMFILTVPPIEQGCIVDKVRDELYSFTVSEDDTEEEEEKEDLKKSLQNDIIANMEQIQKQEGIDAIVKRDTHTQQAYKNYMGVRDLPQMYGRTEKSAITLIALPDFTKEEKEFIASWVADTLVRVKSESEAEKLIASSGTDTLVRIKSYGSNDREVLYKELLQKAAKKSTKTQLKLKKALEDTLDKAKKNNKSAYENFLKSTSESRGDKKKYAKTEQHAIELISTSSLTQEEQKCIALWAVSQLNPSLDDLSKKENAADNLLLKVSDIKRALDKIKDDCHYDCFLKYKQKEHAIKLLSNPSLTKNEQRSIALWATSQLNPSLNKSSTEIVVSHLLRKSQQPSIDNNPVEAMPTELLKELKSNSKKIMEQISLVRNGYKSFDNIRTSEGLIKGLIKEILDSSTFYKELDYIDKLMYHNQLLEELKKRIPSSSQEFILGIIAEHLKNF